MKGFTRRGTHAVPLSTHPHVFIFAVEFLYCFLFSVSICAVYFSDSFSSISSVFTLWWSSHLSTHTSLSPLLPLLLSGSRATCPSQLWAPQDLYSLSGNLFSSALCLIKTERFLRANEKHIRQREEAGLPSASQKTMGALFKDLRVFWFVLLSFIHVLS